MLILIISRDGSKLTVDSESMKQALQYSATPG